ncbi:Protein RETICULATA-RELATED 4, chloroplastic [Asimina triloba]
MAAAAAGSLNLPTSRRFSFTDKCNQRSSSRLFTGVLHRSSRPASSLTWHHCGRGRKPVVVVRSGGGGNVGGGGGGGGGGSSGVGDGGYGEEGGANERNRAEAFLALAEMGRSLESLPADLRAAVQEGRIPGAIVRRFAEMENSPVLKWLLQFGGFKERLLADDLFLAKVAMECGVGPDLENCIFQTAAEWERRRENFIKELDFVIADVVMAIIADFMLVWLPAPTVSLRPALTLGAGPISRFFHSCPDNAFQRNGSKLFVVGTASSLVGTSIMNTLINARKAVDKDFAEEAEDVPILSTTVAYGSYMAVSSNLRYQMLAGVIEQRILEPLLHQQKILLSAACFAVRTGNTFLGSLMKRQSMFDAHDFFAYPFCYKKAECVKRFGPRLIEAHPALPDLGLAVRAQEDMHYEHVTAYYQIAILL